MVVRSAFRRAVAIFGAVGLGLTLAAPATADNNVQRTSNDTVVSTPFGVEAPTPVDYAQDPGMVVGPSCGLEWLETPPAMPTEYTFQMSDGTEQTLPVKVVRQPRDQVVTETYWNALVNGRLTTDEPWGLESNSTSLNLIVTKPGDPADGFKGKPFTIKRNRLLITDQAPVNITVDAGEQPALPAAIDITYQGQDTCQNAETAGTKSSPITWDELTAEQRQQLNTPGATLTIHGTVHTTVPGSDTPLTWPRTSTNSHYGYDATATITVNPTTPVDYAQDPGMVVGPSCGLEWLETPPAMPTEYTFQMSDGTEQTLPVKVVRQPRDQVVTETYWNALVNGRLTTDEPWGLESNSTSLNLIVTKPGDPADGFKGKPFTIKRNRLLITDQAPVNITVDAGEQPALPAAIDITYQGQDTCQNAETAGTKSSPITWDELTAEQRQQLNTPGATLTIHGTVHTTVPGSDTPLTWPRTSTNSHYGYDATATITVNPTTPPAPAPDPTEPAPSPEPTEPAPSPEPTEPAPSPEPTEPAPSPEPTEPAPSPEPTEPAPSPEPTEPAPSPEPTEPAPSPEPTEPAPSPEPTEPAPNPEPTEPAPSPEPTEPAPSPEPTEPAPSPEPTEPAPNPEPTEPAPSPEPTEPAPSPDPTEPAPSPEPTEPAPSPEPTEPAPSPEPTEPAPNPERTEPALPQRPPIGGNLAPDENGDPAKPLPGDAELPITGAGSLASLGSASVLSIAGAVLVLTARRPRKA